MTASRTQASATSGCDDHESNTLYDSGALTSFTNHFSVVPSVTVASEVTVAEFAGTGCCWDTGPAGSACWQS